MGNAVTVITRHKTPDNALAIARYRTRFGASYGHSKDSQEENLSAIRMYAGNLLRILAASPVERARAKPTAHRTRADTEGSSQDQIVVRKVCSAASDGVQKFIPGPNGWKKRISFKHREIRW